MRVARPFRLKPWHYVFYLDLEGHTDEYPVSEALHELRSQAKFVKILGSYPRATIDSP